MIELNSIVLSRPVMTTRSVEILPVPREGYEEEVGSDTVDVGVWLTNDEKEEFVPEKSDGRWRDLKLASFN